MLYPATDLSEACRLEVVHPMAAAPLFPNEPRLPKNSQVFRRSRAAQVKKPSEFAGGPWPIAEFVENDAPRVVGNSAEDIGSHWTMICRKFPTYQVVLRFFVGPPLHYETRTGRGSGAPVPGRA